MGKKKTAKKATAKKSSKTASKKSFEQTLWDTADKLRGTVESSEYKHVVLSLIFLKFTSDKFEKRKQELIDEGQEDYVDMVDFYTMKNVFYLPEESRWSTIQKQAKQNDIAVKIDTALHSVEKNNKSLRGALPDNYFSRLNLEVNKLAALIDSINNIDTIADVAKESEEDVVGRVYEYFLGKFAATEGKGGGEFYTPKCIVNLIAEMIEPYSGKIYDPCCGSGGMFALSRYAGFRCPSEHLPLRLDDIDWEHDRILVTSPKTARHVGHESRVIPIFPELRPYLEEIFHSAEDGTEYFINRYRNACANIRTQMTRIVKSAGLKPWPRIFDNLRSSRQTELEESIPSHVVCKWIGNSPQVARRHYLQTTDEHFERAIKDNAESNTETTQNTTQQPNAVDRGASQRGGEDGDKH